MRLDRWLFGAVLLTAVVAVAVYPLLGWPGSVPIGAAAFGVAALIGAGYDAIRSVVWGAFIAVLIASGLLLPDPFGSDLYAASAVLFFAGFLAPPFRHLWFGTSIE